MKLSKILSLFALSALVLAGLGVSEKASARNPWGIPYYSCGDYIYHSTSSSPAVWAIYARTTDTVFSQIHKIRNDRQDKGVLVDSSSNPRGEGTPTQRTQEGFDLIVAGQNHPCEFVTNY